MFLLKCKPSFSRPLPFLGAPQREYSESRTEADSMSKLSGITKKQVEKLLQLFGIFPKILHKNHLTGL